MEKLIVIVVDEQTKAWAGVQALRELDRDGEISLFDAQIAAKAPNGNVRVLENPDDTGFPMIGVSALVGSLVGVFGGPIGLLGGAAAGALIGSMVELQRGDVTEGFVNDVRTAMAPGSFAVVADIWEDSITPLDMRIEKIGGVVFRRTRGEIGRMHHGREVAAHRAEIEQLKAERAQARSERLAKIDAELDRLGQKLEKAILRERSNILFREEERDARIRVLRAKAEQSNGEIRRRLEERIDELRRDGDTHSQATYHALEGRISNDDARTD